MHAKIIIDDGGDVKKLKILEVHMYSTLYKDFFLLLRFPSNGKNYQD